MQKGLIVYSSKTGNTRKVAEGVARRFSGLGVEVRLAAVEEKPVPGDGEWVLVGFWADRGDADEKAREYLKSLRDRYVGVFGTLGAYPDSDHAREIAKKVEELTSAQNTFLGSFMCQGKIDPALTEQFKSLPKEHPHGMTEERMKRHQEAAKHPDDADIAAASEACMRMTARVGAETLC